VDVVAPLADAGFMADLLTRRPIVTASAHGADALLCLHANPKLTTALQAAGYRLRQPSRYLLVRPGPVDGEQRRRLLDGNSWYVTHGDSDVDRP
jgi:hypothetical protein